MDYISGLRHGSRLLNRSFKIFLFSFCATLAIGCLVVSMMRHFGPLAVASHILNERQIMTLADK
ncbi:hypothetical protein Rleg5DRAFT_6551 [Rhizobium leguminosarum bv. viciae WSM1455]|nr:hypothetical protein Rleg5DRAFT_6551 [Rhizobium leguminosarum bv. viciae WSM1455]